jgi:hypothetical protein
MMKGPPPFELVQLSTLPQERWKGLPVFHPFEQRGDEAKWVEEVDHENELEEETLYDVGVVLRWEPDPDFADLGGIRVHFLGSFGSLLHYDATNLWVPKDVLR